MNIEQNTKGKKITQLPDSLFRLPKIKLKAKTLMYKIICKTDFKYGLECWTKRQKLIVVVEIKYISQASGKSKL